jgi:hypothetical protein
MCWGRSRGNISEMLEELQLHSHQLKWCCWGPSHSMEPCHGHNRSTFFHGWHTHSPLPSLRIQQRWHSHKFLWTKKCPGQGYFSTQDIHNKYDANISTLDSGGRLQRHSHVGGEDWRNKVNGTGQW